ncbi:MAG: DUF2127 domain-containing protein [Nitrospiraceae bacterium]|nr:DUF2127 domain-containing protein [Nitrospiraceae bacterium]OQW67342.1 MAG: hypothetical protein BVN29_03535 [Nitrospira sp. ST-bin5]
MMTTRTHHAGLAAIAVLKMVKGVLLLFLGLGLLKLVHAEIATLFSLLIEALYLNADSWFIHGLVLKVDALQPHGVWIAGVISLGYAGLMLVEGVGLWLEFSWAAYLTVVSTSLLIPVELYEIIDRVTLLRVGALLLNLVIVGYLLSQLKHHHLRKRAG